MKSLLVLLVAGFLATAAHAQSLLISDFSSSHFNVEIYSTASTGPWSNATASYGATSYSIGNFGNGTPSGGTGNGFVIYGDTAQDWSAFSTLEFTAKTLAGNATSTVNFYMEDASGRSSTTSFNLADFVNGATVSTLLNKGTVDMTQISFWGFATVDFAASAFALEFDNLALGVASAVPEPSTYALMFGGVVLAGAIIRRRCQNRG